MTRGWSKLIVGGALLLAVTACGDDDADTGSSGSVTTAPAPATTEPATTPPTTAPPTTAATTTPPSTAAPSTSAAPTTGWEIVDELPAWAFPPCCADVWKAPGPSPQLPAGDTPLEDGVYYAEISEWSPATPDRITLTIHRFERCDRLAELGTQECDSMWAPDNVDVLDEGAIEREFPLDASFGAGMTGISCDDGTNFDGVLYNGDGPALEELLTALETDYDTWVRKPLEAGTDQMALMEELAADPASPFSIVCDEIGVGFGLGWSADDGPTILFQSLPIYDLELDAVVPRSPAQLLLPASLEIVDGNPVLYLYESFRS